jgi:hypothetical protein
MEAIGPALMSSAEKTRQAEESVFMSVVNVTT